MRITVPIDQTTIDVDVPEALSNAAGAVTVDNGYPRISVKPDAGMKAAGITTVKSVTCRETVKGFDVLTVQTNKGKGYLRLDSRPDLVALRENYEAIRDAISAAREVIWSEQRRQQQDADEALRVGMRAEAEKLAAKIPAGHLRVEVAWTEHADSGAFFEYSAGGTKLGFRDVTVHGDAVAMRPRALHYFDLIRVASISPEKLAAVRAVQAEKQAKADAEEAQRQAERDQRNRRRAELQRQVSCRVVKRGVHQGEEPDPYADVELTSTETGESLQFRCRNIFDVGYTVNPTYAVADGLKPGGLADVQRDGDCKPVLGGRLQWMDFQSGHGWLPVRLLTDFEALCLDYLREFPPISTEVRL